MGDRLTKPTFVQLLITIENVPAALGLGFYVLN